MTLDLDRFAADILAAVRPWPRLLDEREAATYLGISPSKLRAGIGLDPPRYPRPMRDGGNVLWDIKVLDAFVDDRSNFATNAPAVAGVKRKWAGS